MRPCASCGEANPETARFCSGCGTALLDGAHEGAATHRERRLVTALFCDLVDSTGLAQRLDAEALQSVLDQYFDAARAVVERHGGRVEKFIGDAVAAVFGIPVAHEDDAVRAGRAALELHEAVASVHQQVRHLGVPLEVRVGLQTGEVVVDLGSRNAQTVGGDTFNTAARLQSAAAPGTVLVGSGTAALLRNAALLEPVAPLQLRGRADTEQAFVLTAMLTPVGGQPMRSGGRFVGRARQLAALHAAFRESTEDQALVLVTVLGEAGIGKSRLTQRLRSEIAAEARVLVGFTPSYGDAVAYAPLLDLLRAATGSTEPDAVRAGLRDCLGDRPDAAAVVERLASLLSADDASVSGDTAWAVRRLLESLAEERPVVVVVEDVHFGGDALLDLLDRVVASVRGPVLVVCTARPELVEQRPTWGGGKARSVTLTLGPLPPADAEQLVEQLVEQHGAGAAAEDRSRLAAAAGGNPLYLEQLAAMLAETGALDHHLATPPTLQALLAARLDRLSPTESRVLDLAAVEGRAFHPAVIGTLDRGLGEQDLRDALDRLERRSLARPLDGDDTWEFVHALVQEAASRRTPKAERAVLHARLADLLDRAEPVADELVASHLERAAQLRREVGLPNDETAELERRAGRGFAAAGSRAYASMDLSATAELLGRAAALLPPADPMRSALLPDLGVALMEIGRVDEAERLLLSAGVAASEGMGEVERARIDIQLLALRGVYRGADPDVVAGCLADGRRIVARLEELDDPVALAQGWVLLEYLSYVLGRMSDAVECCRSAVRAAERAGRVRELLQAGGDLGDYLGSGFLPVTEVERVAAELSLESGPVWQLATLAATAAVHAYRGDRESFVRTHGAWDDLGQAYGLEWPRAQQLIAFAQAWVELGDDVAAEHSLRTVMEVMERIGDTWSYSCAAWMLPEILDRQGRQEEALAQVNRAEPGEGLAVLDTGARIYERRAAALGLRLRGRTVEAEAACRSALEIAVGTEYAILVTSSLEMLADLVATNGRPDEARTLLERALSLHDELGNLAGARRVRGRLHDHDAVAR